MAGKGFIYKDINPDPRFDANPAIYDDQAILQNIANLLSTKKFTIPFTPDYGIDLDSSLFSLMTPATELVIVNEITNAIDRYEKRLTVRDVDVVANFETNTYNVTISGEIKGKINQQVEFSGTLESLD